MRIPRSLVVLMTMLLLSSAQAETARFALVIGNADYAGAAALANPANDASDVAAALTSVGWTVTTLLNGDRKAMNRSLFEFRDLLRAAENPVALFYYAGHGLQISGLNYLLPVGENFETADEVLSDAISLPSMLAATTPSSKSPPARWVQPAD